MERSKARLYFAVKQYYIAESKAALDNLQMKDLWKRMRNARLKAGMSQEAIGKKCWSNKGGIDKQGISKAAVGLWESGDQYKRTTPELHNLIIFAEATGASLDYLLLGKGDLDKHPMSANSISDAAIDIAIRWRALPSVLQEQVTQFILSQEMIAKACPAIADKRVLVSYRRYVAYESDREGDKKKRKEVAP